MTNISTTSPTLQSEAETRVHLLDNWFDAIEVGLRERIREFIQAMIESELETALARKTGRIAAVRNTGRDRLSRVEAVIRNQRFLPLMIDPCSLLGQALRQQLTRSPSQYMYGRIVSC